MTPEEVTGWLRRLADSLEHWPAATNDKVCVPLFAEQPAAALRRIVDSEIGDEPERTAVLRALPRALPDDYGDAARRIRALAASFD
jgi:hypothetical protein